MNDVEKQKLLEKAREAARNLAIAKEERRAAVLKCLDADIPRQEIADALGMHRNSIYRILESD